MRHSQVLQCDNFRHTGRRFLIFRVSRRKHGRPRHISIRLAMFSNNRDPGDHAIAAWSGPAMNKWVLAAILTAAALFMYVSIFVKVGSG